MLEELDRLKNSDGDRGSNARQAIRLLENLRLSGSLTEGVPLPGGGFLRLEVNHVDVPLPEGMQPCSQDNRILKVCKGLCNQGESVILVTRDIVVRIKAQMMGIPAEDFTTDQVPAPSGQYTGRAEVYAPDEALSSFKKKGVPAELLYTVDDDGTTVPVTLIENQFVLIRSDISEKKTVLGRFHKGKVVA